MRLRITFAKYGALRYCGHLDLNRTWERTIRRAKLPLIYSQAFHPQPKIHLAAALPLGFIGRHEVMDIWLEDSTPIPEIKNRLQTSAPPGLELLQVVQVDEHLPLLQTQVVAAAYNVTLLDPLPVSEISSRLAAVMGAGLLLRERRGRTYDLRPMIESLDILPLEKDGLVRLSMRLSAQPGATGRPEEVLAEMGIAIEDTRIERTNLFFQDSS
jgi:radical SAM-linked protein